VENGLVTFLQAQQRTKFQAASVTDAQEAVQIAVAQYKAGIVDFTRVTQLETTLVTQQDTLAQAQGEIVTGLIQVYKALGGGWQIRETGCDPQRAERMLWPGPETPPQPGSQETPPQQEIAAPPNTPKSSED
jgi:hypothetical protein